MDSNVGLRLDQIDLIKATVPIIAEHGKTIADVLYKNLFAENPAFKTVFNIPNQVNGRQSRALSSALYDYALHIDNLDAFTSTLEKICNKHASLYVQPAQYKVIYKYLIEAMANVLGDALTPEIKDAWTTAYWQLAHLLMARENRIYRESEGWTDWREFTIKDKVQESEEITSFYLSPVDGKPLPSFRPGQYASIQLFVPELNHVQSRQYSLSDKPNPEYYRISVKREASLSGEDASSHRSYVSNLLYEKFNKGDIFKVSHPCGDFFLSAVEDASSYPVVLLSAGVGLAPLTSILNALTSASASKERRLHFIHGARTSSVRAFKQHILTLSKEFPNLNVTFFTTYPSEDEKEGDNYHVTGRVDLAKLDRDKDLFLDNPTTEYFVSGPTEFMKDTVTGLKQRGVCAERIKIELFSPGGYALDWFL